MHELLEILKYTLPSLLVFVAAFFVMKKFLDNEYRKLLFELKRSNLKTITPIRLQAYERATLFLERINMENLITRVNQPGMKADQLQMSLVTSIRSEYEHNLSQQIYMSDDAWDAVKTAKEETVKIIHLSMARINGKGSALDLSKSIFELLEEEGTSPYIKAVTVIKKEVKHLF
jgi:hypothetical protein